MKQAIYKLAASIVFIAFACGVASAKGFDEYGISFSYPTDWHITENSDADDTQFISVEKEGIESSGMVAMQTLNKIYDIDSFVDAYRDSMANNDVFDDLEFSSVTSGAYGHYSCDTFSYSMSVMGIPHHGRIYIIDDSDRYVIIMEQEADEDRAVNATGFDAIRTSLTLQ